MATQTTGILAMHFCPSERVAPYALSPGHSPSPGRQNNDNKNPKHAVDEYKEELVIAKQCEMRRSIQSHGE